MSTIKFFFIFDNSRKHCEYFVHMSILKKIFSNLLSFREPAHDEEESKYLPDKEIPVDEQFTCNFKENGGKFLYCENEEELEETFISILQENDWFEQEALTFETRFVSLLKDNRIDYKAPKQPVFILCSCEGLVAEDGSILFSSKQFQHFKSNELPKNMIIMGRTSQILRTKSDGLRTIKNKYAGNIPTNITTLQHFKNVKTDDFLQYGIEPKNLYLLLLEDL